MDEPCAALKEYTELVEAWERLGVLDTAPDYEEWLEQQYDEHLLRIETGRARWKRKTERVHELEAALKPFAFTKDERFETQTFGDEETIFLRPDDGNDSVTNGWRKQVTFADCRRATGLLGSPERG